MIKIRLMFFTRDHPRLCGEKVKLTCWQKIGTGSPPPMRGKVAQFPPDYFQTRITPAYAGKSYLFHQRC